MHYRENSSRAWCECNFFASFVIRGRRPCRHRRLFRVPCFAVLFNPPPNILIGSIISSNGQRAIDSMQGLEQYWNRVGSTQTPKCSLLFAASAGFLLQQATDSTVVLEQYKIHVRCTQITSFNPLFARTMLFYYPAIL